MTIQKFIEKAIEGGWQQPSTFYYLYNYKGKMGYENSLSVDFQHTLGNIPLAVIFLDPIAWQAVGRVDGWSNMDGVGGKYTYPTEAIPYWKHNMHCMIDALAEGKTLEDFIGTL